MTVLADLLPLLLSALVAAPGSDRPNRPEGAPAEPVAEAPPETDAIEQIRITGQHTARAAPAESFDALPQARMQRSDARSAAELLLRAPGALVQTNSRGQTLVYLRNAGERQVSIFFDGAPLEIPWDHRFDLGLMPAAAIGRIEVARGPLSNRYGPNVSGGAVFLEPLSPPDHPAARLGAEGGAAGQLRIEGAVGAAPSDRTALALAAERTEWSGEPLADELPFSQGAGGLRTNTDAQRTSALARAELDLDSTELSLSVLYGSAALGVAPEGHVDPAEAPVRYWRYPDTELAMAIARAESRGRTWALDAVAWVQAFDQTIESYVSDRYRRLAERQEDADRSLGGRARVAGSIGPHRLSLSASGSWSSHDERRLEALDTDAPASEQARFVHGLWSLGADYLLETERLRVRVGGGLDGLEPVETAGFPSAGGIRGWNASAGAQLALGPKLSLRAAAGSRARLPTPRELYGTALDRFVLNPELGPERVNSLELALAYRDPWIRLELVPFGSWTVDTLDQENVVVGGREARRRVNLDGSRALGVELVAELQLTRWLRGAGQLLLTDARTTDAAERPLTERPAAQVFAELVAGEAEGLELAAEVVARSASFSLTPEGLRRVPGAALLNVRLAYRMWQTPFGDVETYARLDNVFDAQLEPQLGLPEPGRWLRAGVTLLLR